MELNWHNANLWLDKANSKKEIHNEPKWNFDCGFKLDFDGALITVSSRFYPPHKNNGNWWEGNLSVYFLGEEIMKKEFKADTLNQLQSEVEEYLKHYSGCLKAKIYR